MNLRFKDIKITYNMLRSSTQASVLLRKSSTRNGCGEKGEEEEEEYQVLREIRECICNELRMLVVERDEE